MDNINNLIRRRTDVDNQNLNLKDTGNLIIYLSIKNNSLIKQIKTKKKT